MKVTSILYSLVLLIGMVSVTVQPVSAAVNCPIAIAHRGNAYYGSPAENSMNAFKASFDSGAKWIETDLQFTKDNVAVLMHDKTVDRMTNGTGAIAQMTAAQFLSLKFDDGQSPVTLDQAIDLMMGVDGSMMLLEVKDVMTAAQEQILAARLSGLEDRILVGAFASRLADVQDVRKLNDRIKISMFAYEPPSTIPEGVSSIDMEHTYVTAAKVERLHAAGVTVRAWTPNSTTIWDNLRAMGVDAIITNKVKLNVEWLASKGCPSAPVAPAVVTYGQVSANEAVPFQTSYVDDVSMPQGTTRIVQQGSHGEKRVTYNVTYTDGVETSRTFFSEAIISEPVQQIVAVGTMPVVNPTVEYITNTDFESSLTGWGTATTTSRNSRVAGGYESSYAIRSINNSSSNTKHGFMASPAPIDGKTTFTAAGRMYDASVWVKPDVAGQRISVYMREVNPSGTTVKSKTVTLTTNSTNWQRLTATYDAAGTGNKLDIHIFATNSASQSGFVADKVSLTSTN